MKLLLESFLLCGLIACTSIGLAQEKAAGAGSFYNITEVVTKWSPTQHLWTKGNLGVRESDLAGLEGWLDKNAVNWTIVLLESASSQSFENRSGMSAVEFALGKGLSNQTDFGKLTDKRTGQANGAVFVLFLKERKFSYFASDVFDSRGLGERYWIGRLDKPAISAMRSGGRIIDAVKNTVTSIESALSRKINEEVERKRLAEIQKQKAIAESKLYASQLRSLIIEAKGRAAKLRASTPGLTGLLVRPNTVPWTASADTVARLAEQGDHQNARKHFTETQNAIQSFHHGLDQWQSDGKRFDPLKKQILSHPSPDRAPAVAGHLATASEALESAISNHTEGDPLYLDQLNTSESALSLASHQYSDWQMSERQRILLIRATLIIILLGITVFLTIANRMRRSSKEEALNLFNTWKKRLAGKFDELFDLMDRTGLVVGSSRDLDERGFIGTTESLARETIHGVDELFIMSAATDQVMEEVETLVAPKTIPAKLLNRFSSRRYRKAIALITSEPIGFDQHDHLESILQPPSTNGDNDIHRTLLGESSDYEPFRISFEKLIEEYDSRQVSATDGIRRLESGIDGLPLTQQQLQTTHDQVDEAANRLTAQADGDTFFPLRALNSDLLPELQKSLDDAAKLGQSDPVEAFEKIIPETSRLAAESDSITDTIRSFREIDLPEIERTLTSLSSLDRDTGWIGITLAALTARSENLASQAASVSIEEPWSEFTDDLTRFKGRCLNCEKLTFRIKDELGPLIEKRTGEIQTTKNTLSAQLGLDRKLLLEEDGLNPSQKLTEAQHAIEAALLSIDHGHATAARETLTETENGLDHATALLALSQTSADQHSKRLKELTDGHRTVSDELAPAELLLEELKTKYAASVLLFSSRFGEDTSGQRSIGESVERAKRRLTQTTEELNSSAAAFNRGELIHAYGLLETIANQLDFARHQLALIHDQHAVLKESENTAATLSETLPIRQRELGILAQDRRTCHSTISTYEALGIELESFVNSLSEIERNPFVDLRLGQNLERQANSVEDGIDSDWKAFDSAESSSTGAKAALTFCNTYLREAKTDGIPDSRALTRAIQRHRELTAEHEAIENELTQAHSDWNRLFEQISAITGETAKVKSTLQSELAAARDAAEQLALATAAISSMHKWRSSYSVKLSRFAGKKSLLRSKQALFQGDYAKARKAAVAARGEALRELQNAKAKESRKASAAAAAARRSARSSFSSGSSFGSSSSSGFSSSSFSSGSGFSRSGW